MHPWAQALRTRFGEAEGSPRVSDLHVESSLVTATVDGEQVSLSAPPIPPGIWAAVNVDAPLLQQTLEHTWEEPLIPADVVEVGEAGPLWRAFAEAVDADPKLLLRWRGYGAEARADDTDPWRGGPLPELPAPARRPPESVPKRFGASTVRVGDEDLVEQLVRVYAAFAARDA